jgi:glutaredoxin
MTPPRVVTLYSKPGCHLCEQLRALVDVLGPEFGFRVEEVDITQDAALFARYRWEIPVLLVDGVEAGRGRLEEGRIRELVRQVR